MMIWLNLAAAAASLMQGGVQTLTVDQAVDLGLKNAFSVRTAESNVEKARQRVKEDEGALGPKIITGATYTRFESKQTAQIGPPGTPPIVIRAIDSKVGTANLQWPIDISGNIRRIVRASQAGLRASEQTLQAQKNDIKQAVRQAYYDVLRAKAQVQVDELAKTAAAERLKNGQQQFDAGVVAKVDVLRFQAQLSQAESDLITAQGNLELAKQFLNNTIARPIETDFEVVDVEVLPEAPVDGAKLNGVAQGERPEAKALEQTVKSLAEVRRSEEGGLNPSLAAGVNYQRTLDASGFGAQDHQTTGTLTLNFPIFDSGVTRARVKQARQDELQAGIQLQQVRLGISLEVRQAVTNLVNAKSRLDVALKQVDAAQEAYRLAQLKYEAGGGIQLEVIDAQTDLTRARTGVVAARYDYLTAYSALQRAVGADNLAAAVGMALGEKK